MILCLITPYSSLNPLKRKLRHKNSCQNRLLSQN